MHIPGGLAGWQPWPLDQFGQADSPLIFLDHLLGIKNDSHEILAIVLGDEGVRILGRLEDIVLKLDSVSVRVRIIDPVFAGKTKVERSNKVWQYLNSLPDEVQSDLSTLILLTPEETKVSFANLEFDDPIPSSL